MWSLCNVSPASRSVPAIADLSLPSDLHCYKTLDACNSDTDGSHGNVNGRALPHNTCSEAPPDCQYIRAVAG